MSLSKEHSKNRLCLIPLCKNGRFDLVHKFPMDNHRAEEWRRAIDLPDINNLPLDLLRKRTICSKHFRKEDYKNIESRSLNKTAIPSLHFKSSGGVDGIVSSLEPEKCNILKATSAFGVDEPTILRRNVMKSRNEPVNKRTEPNNSQKYLSKTDDVTEMISDQEPPPKYRLIQTNQMEAVETQLSLIPVSENIEDSYVALMPEFNNCSSSIQETIAFIDQPGAQQLEFVTTKRATSFIQNAQTYLNEIIQVMKPCYVSKCHLLCL